MYKLLFTEQVARFCYEKSFRAKVLTGLAIHGHAEADILPNSSF